ncbi:hypothetical protein EFD55_22525 [Rhizobium pisi]|uniref:Uncharacterized protein n=1 Tax=Rhizobium pisi TaxID=574561 RepID=A0A427MGB8_9HYPH|nr:hypothetical protein EFD55_22525 [Rhizobium pisi]
MAGREEEIAGLHMRLASATAARPRLPAATASSIPIACLKAAEKTVHYLRLILDLLIEQILKP